MASGVPSATPVLELESLFVRIYADATQYLSTVPVVKKATDALNASIMQFEKIANSASNAFNKLAKGSTPVPPELDQVSRSAADASQKLSVLSTRGMGVYRTFMLMRLAVAGFAGYSLYEFGKVDDILTRSMTHMNDWGSKSRSTLEKSVLGLSMRSTSSAGDLASAQDTLIRGGFNPAAAMRALAVTEDMAVASGMNVKDTAEKQMEILNSLGLVTNDVNKNIKEMTQLSDLLTGTANATGSSVEKLAQALGPRFSVEMSRNNIALKDGVALLGAFSLRGMRGAEGGEEAARFLAQMSKAAIQHNLEWARLGVSVYNNGQMRAPLDILSQLDARMKSMSPEVQRATLYWLGFERQGVAAASALLGMSEQFKQLIDMTGGMEGFTHAAAEMVRHDFLSQLKILWNSLSGIGYVIGRTLAPAVAYLALGLDALGEWFVNLNPAASSFIVTIGVMTGGLLLLAPTVRLLGWVFGSLGRSLSIVGSGVATVLAVLGAGAGGVAGLIGTLGRGVLSLGVGAAGLGLGAGASLVGGMVGAGVLGGRALMGLGNLIRSTYVGVRATLVTTASALRLVSIGVESVVGFLLNIGMVLQNIRSLTLLLRAIGPVLVGAVTLPLRIAFSSVAALTRLMVSSLIPVLRVAAVGVQTAVGFLLNIGIVLQNIGSLTSLLRVIGPLIVDMFVAPFRLAFSLIGGFFEFFTSAIRTMGTLLSSVFKAGFMALLDFAAALPGLILNVVAVLVTLTIWVAILTAFSSLIITIGIGVGQLFAVVMGGLAAAWAAVRNGLASTGDWLTGQAEAVVGMWDGAKSAVSDYFNMVVDVGDKLIGFFWNFGDNIIIIWRWIGRNWRPLAEDIGTITKLLVEGIVQNIRALGNFILATGNIAWSGFFSLVGIYMEPVFTTMKDQWQNILDDMGMMFKTFAGNVVRNMLVVLGAMGGLAWMQTQIAGVDLKTNALLSNADAAHARVFGPTDETTWTLERARIKKEGEKSKQELFDSFMGGITSQFHAPLEGMGAFKTDFGHSAVTELKDIGFGHGPVNLVVSPASGIFAGMEKAGGLASGLLGGMQGDISKAWGGTKLTNPLKTFQATTEALVPLLKLEKPPDWQNRFEGMLRNMMGVGRGEGEGMVSGERGPGFKFQQISTARYMIGGPAMVALDRQQLVTLENIDQKLETINTSINNTKQGPPPPVIRR